MPRALAVLVCVLALMSPSVAQENPSVPKFESLPAKQAISSFQETLAALDKARDEQIDLARAKLREDLESALKEAVEKKDFAEVQRISSLIESDLPIVEAAPTKRRTGGATRLQSENENLKRELAATKMLASVLKENEALVQFVRGKSYKTNNRLWHFAEDGSLAINGKPAGRWAVLGRQTVVTLIYDGNHIDYFEFSQDGSKIGARYLGSPDNKKTYPGQRVQ